MVSGHVNVECRTRVSGGCNNVAAGASASSSSTSDATRAVMLAAQRLHSKVVMQWNCSLNGVNVPACGETETSAFKQVCRAPVANIQPKLRQPISATASAEVQCQMRKQCSKAEGWQAHP